MWGRTVSTSWQGGGYGGVNGRFLTGQCPGLSPRGGTWPGTAIYTPPPRPPPPPASSCTLLPHIHVKGRAEVRWRMTQAGRGSGCPPFRWTGMGRVFFAASTPRAWEKSRWGRHSAKKTLIFLKWVPILRWLWCDVMWFIPKDPPRPQPWPTYISWQKLFRLNPKPHLLARNRSKHRIQNQHESSYETRYFLSVMFKVWRGPLGEEP